MGATGLSVAPDFFGKQRLGFGANQPLGTCGFRKRLAGKPFARFNETTGKPAAWIATGFLRF